MVSDHSRLPPPAGVALSLPIHPASLLRPGCRYQSRGACGQTASPVRSGMTPTAARQRGVRVCRVDRGRREPSPFGRAAEHARSAARASPGHRPAHSAPPTTSRRQSIQQPHSSPIIPIIVPSLLLFRMSWRYRSRGACGQTVSPVLSGMTPTAARQRGGGSVPRRPGAGESHHHSAELRSMRD